jgi:hypothetical protein
MLIASGLNHAADASVLIVAINSKPDAETRQMTCKTWFAPARLPMVRDRSLSIAEGAAHVAVQLGNSVVVNIYTRISCIRPTLTASERS